MKSNFFLFIYAKTTGFLFLLLSIFRLWYWWHCVVKSRTFTTRPPWTMTLHVLWTQLGWHALEIDMKIFPTHANYKTQLDFTPNWHPQVSCSKGSGKEAGYEGPPHVGEEWTIYGGPHNPPPLLSPYRSTLCHSELWSLEINLQPSTLPADLRLPLPSIIALALQKKLWETTPPAARKSTL